jgi:hypothetical protein
LFARVAVEVLVSKTPVVEFEQPFVVPLEPALGVPHVKGPLVPPLTDKGTPVPDAMLVTTTVFVEGLAENPTEAAQTPMAVLKLPAKVVVLLLFIKVPVYVELEPLQVFCVPSVPAVLTHPTPLPLAPEKVAPIVADAPGVRSLRVTVAAPGAGTE